MTSRQLVAAYLARIDALNHRGPHLGALITTHRATVFAAAAAADRARAEGRVRGPLAGIPVVVKDNFDTVDFATTAGAKAMLGSPPGRDATVVRDLRAAGAIILGKANMSEWATSIAPRAPLGFSDVGGFATNAYDNGDPGGSSNGSAIAAASTMAATTLGTETSGSIIFPALLDSVVGIKPTHGLTSRAGVVPLLDQFDVPGPIARSVSDAALTLDQMVGIDPRDPETRKQRGHVPRSYLQFLRAGALHGARVGVPRGAASRDPRLRITGLVTIRRALIRAGAVLVDVPDTLFVHTFPVYAKSLFKQQLDDYLQHRKHSPQRSLASIVAFNRRRGLRAVRFGQQFLTSALATTPAQARTAALRIRALQRDDSARLSRWLKKLHLDAYIVSPVISSLTVTPAGYPSITVPAGYDGKHPFGVIFAGRRWDEGRLIALGFSYEQATHARRSPALINPRFAAACSR